MSLADVDGDLHVCATTLTPQLNQDRVLHAIRYRNGTWTGFGDVLRQTGAPSDPVEDIDCAGYGSEMHIAVNTTYDVYHAIRFASGWTGLGGVEETEAGHIDPGIGSVSITKFASDMHLVVDKNSTRAFHTARHNAGSWIPFKAVPTSDYQQSISTAGTQDFLHLVKAGVTGAVEHQTRDAFGNWSGVGNVYNAAGNNPGTAIWVAAASGIAY